jgi:alpha-glucosidase
MLILYHILLSGILLKLDHFVDIGIGGVWLSPIFKSPMKDFGYDVSDFRDIDPLFGTMADFEELAAGCKERGTSIIYYLNCKNNDAFSI